MLLHVTVRHDADNCPGFDEGLRDRTIDAYRRLDEIAAKYGIVIREHYQAAPDHVEYMVVEADSNFPLALFFSDALPYKADFDTKVVSDRATMATIFATMSAA